jgi:hypothetical protein
MVTKIPASDLLYFCNFNFSFGNSYFLYDSSDEAKLYTKAIGFNTIYNFPVDFFKKLF